MFRFILWALLFYFAWKILSSFMRLRNRPSQDDRQNLNHQQVEEADFEDITDNPDREKDHGDTKTPNGKVP